MTLFGAEESNSGVATFVQSELFARTFREGMALVEETADYLDGEGRAESKALPREAALAYAGASMRLTTLLMQIASWLLVLRAVREGEMALDEAADQKYRLEAASEWREDFHSEGMPEALIGLMETTHQLYRRISRLDADLFSAEGAQVKDSDAAGQQRALMRAFGAGQ